MKADGWANPYDTADDISQLADNQGFDFDNLHTFDSDTFPKPFLGDMLDCGNTDMGATEHEKCDSCRTNLCGGE